MQSLTILKGFLSFAFLLAGGAKVVGARPLKEQFEEFGLPVGMMRVVGALELAGAAGLQYQPLALWAAVGLAALMVGAVANHVKAKHPLSKSAPAVVLLLGCVAAAWMMSGQAG